MRARTQQPAGTGGTFILLLGGAFLALALLLLGIRLYGAGTSQPLFHPAADPYQTTNGVIAFWEQRVHENPGDFVAYNNLADGYLRRARETGDVSDYGRAEAAVTASLGELSAQNNYSALTLQASLYNVKHEFEAARVAAEQALVIRPDDSFARSVLGDAQLALGDYDAAFATYLDLVDRSPSVASFSRMAHIYELRGELAQADAAWQNALNIDTARRPETTAWTRTQYGHFLFMQGNLDEAGHYYDAAQEALANYVHATAGRARIAAARGEYDEAIALYTTVVGRQPVLEYVIALGDVYRVADREADAQRQYSLVDAIDRLYKANGINTDAELSVFLADHPSGDADVGEAVRRAQQAYTARPDSISSADSLAWALYRAGRTQEATVFTKQATRLGTQDPLLLFHAGMIANTTGDRVAARDYLSRTVALNPNFSVLHSGEAKTVLGELTTSAETSR